MVWTFTLHLIIATRVALEDPWTGRLPTHDQITLVDAFGAVTEWRDIGKFLFGS